MNKEELHKLNVILFDNLDIEIYSNVMEYITLLQQENKQLKEQVDKYENPEDMTLMYMWCSEKVKDENKQLKERIDKAIEYIEKDNVKVLEFIENLGIPDIKGKDIYTKFHLLKILKR